MKDDELFDEDNEKSLPLIREDELMDDTTDIPRSLPASNLHSSLTTEKFLRNIEDQKRLLPHEDIQNFLPESPTWQREVSETDFQVLEIEHQKKKQKSSLLNDAFQTESKEDAGYSEESMSSNFGQFKTLPTQDFTQEKNEIMRKKGTLEVQAEDIVDEVNTMQRFFEKRRKRR